MVDPNSEVHDESADLADAIATAGEEVETLQVSLSNEVVHLLSEQLYTSPLKAIEELVVNGYDADAKECRVALLLDQAPHEEGAVNAGASAVPEAEEDHDGSDVLDADAISEIVAQLEAPRGVIAIYDDGEGMDVPGLKELWKIGDSPKRRGELQKTTSGRLIIGKFGIGKLATYAVGSRVTYITAKAGAVHHVVCDFRLFKHDPSGGTKPVELTVRRIDNLDELLERDDFKAVLQQLGIKPEDLSSTVSVGWTLCVLDHLKPKARELQIGRLSWVLRTAMPLKTDFKVYLNGQEQVSTKENIKRPVEFSVAQIDPVRLTEFNDKFKTSFVVDGSTVKEPELFPMGLSGELFVAERSLLGKADLLIGRSNGFFVYVRGRLINAEDPLFHNTPLSYETFNRFRADLNIDDLNDEVTAPREGVEVGRRRTIASAMARELFNQARELFEKWQKENEDPKKAPEHIRTYVAPRFVERPVADVLAMQGTEEPGVDADKGWFYMRPLAAAALSEVVDQLYAERKKYKYTYIGLGESERLTKFNPADATFTINADHDLVRAFTDEPRSRELMELFATTEVMLEVYMKEAGVLPHIVTQVLEQRDMLLRSLAQDRVYSLEAIAASLRENKDNETQLELALVAAARALGFNAKHVSGSGTPDGVARLLDSAMNETIFTLEAKSSQGVPTLPQLDFAGLKEHKEAHGADGCLLIAPAYPGADSLTSAVATRATADKISCWTVDQLARVVEHSERLQITARQISEIITSTFTPADVTAAVEKLFETKPDMERLYTGVMTVLRDMFARKTLQGDQRKISQVAAILSLQAGFEGITENEVRRAVADIAHASRGAISVSDDVILFFNSVEELERRVSSLTGSLGEPRSIGTFRAPPEEPSETPEQTPD